MSCNRVFATADTHFHHNGIIKWELARQRFLTIEEHDRELVERWNATVKPNDTVWHLGDVYFGGSARHEVLGYLHGVKKLVMGNHDQYPMAVYQQYFSRIYGAAEYRHCILTHVPVHPDQFRRYARNIHGHMHSAKMKDPRYICVSVEHHDLRPVLFDTLLATPQPHPGSWATLSPADAYAAGYGDGLAWYDSREDQLR
jgi:calcineurin-like phosphoesterase family protein